MDKEKKKRVTYYVLMTVIFLLAVFVVGPLVYDSVLTPMKPYLLVDVNEYRTALAAGQCKSCDVPPILPIEMKSEATPPENIYKLPVEKVPTEYKPYVHYPDNWNAFYNPFQPNGIGPILQRILNWLVPICGVAVLAYGTWAWKKGRFKNFMQRMKP